MFEKYAKDSPSRRLPLTLRFAFSSPAHILATFFGSGVLRPASGTWGTLAGLLFYVALSPVLSTAAWIVFIVAGFFAGSWACGVTGGDCGVYDHSSIVIDEAVAIWLVLLTVPATPLWTVLSFLAFRLFDIVKLPPASTIDRDFHTGMGVMLDDIAAGVYAIILVQVLRLII